MGITLGEQAREPSNQIYSTSLVDYAVYHIGWSAGQSLWISDGRSVLLVEHGRTSAIEQTVERLIRRRSSSGSRRLNLR
jgi:hypothetical protein